MNAIFFDHVDDAYHYLDSIRIFKKLGTAILKTIYQNMLVAFKITSDAKVSLDISLTSTLIPQLESLSIEELDVIEGLYNNKIVECFKNVQSQDRQSYSKSFKKILNYLSINDAESKIKEFDDGKLTSNDQIWKEISNAVGKKNTKSDPTLFKLAITDLKETAVI